MQHKESEMLQDTVMGVRIWIRGGMYIIRISVCPYIKRALGFWFSLFGFQN